MPNKKLSGDSYANYSQARAKGAAIVNSHLGEPCDYDFATNA
jgi:hypothetical protein